MKTIKEIQEEFDHVLEGFETEKLAVLENESLRTMMAKHPLYEIEPFFSEHNNEIIDENTPSFLISTAEDFDPEKDQLYEFKFDVDSRKVFFRTEVFGGGTSYDTVFSYTDEFYRSATIYINPESKTAIKLAYLFFKDGVPYQYIECGEYGTVSKKYKTDNDQLLGYIRDYVEAKILTEVSFSYRFDGALASITEKEPGADKESILFKRPDKDETIETTLETIENLLVEEMADQILERVNIDEKVYCILFEYTMQHAFPPTIGIGVVSDVDGDRGEKEIYELYNAPDMRYFSESGIIDIDLYTPALQDAYLFYDRTFDFTKNDDEAYFHWQEKVREVYLRVCKRLMHFNFSKSFSKTDDFLVLAKDFEECNEEFYYNTMVAYRQLI